MADVDREAIRESEGICGGWGAPLHGRGHEFERSLDREGVALYHCVGIARSHWERRGPRLGGVGGRPGGAASHLEPHRQLGTKGGVAVTE